MTRTSTIVRRTLTELRWHIFWYGCGTALYAVFMILLFPSFKETLTQTQYPEEFLQFFGVGSDLSNAAVFLSAEYISFIPLVLMVFALVAGTGALAGEEGRGTLEIVLAQPVPRARLYWAKVLALMLAIAAILAIIIAGWVAILLVVDLEGEVTVADAVLAHVGMFPVIAWFAAAGVFAGAIAPSRGQGAGILAALLIASYLATSLAQVVDRIAWMRWFSPYTYLDGPTLLMTGPVAGHVALLLAGAAVFAVLGLLGFAGREIGAGTWQPGALARGFRALRPGR
ncbi:MAG: hypothetical protein AMXMBFR23_15970 [Chloroflexota bacterium]